MRVKPACTQAALIAVAVGAIACGHRESNTAPPNVLLITIDTLRADRLGVGTAPALDHLGSTSRRFTAARTAAPLTLPSHATIHTGLLPPQHGLRENGAGALAPAHATLATLLKRAGYRTAAFVGAFVLDRRFGLGEGFDTYDDQIPRRAGATDRLEAERPASEVVSRALAWLSAYSSPFPDPASNARSNRRSNPQSPIPNPFFLWIHLYDPHAPYTPPVEFRARAKTPYDGEVAYADAEIARLFEAMKTSADFDRTLIVVAGDHGEGLGEHGELTHGMLLYDATLRVPLLIHAPGVAPAAIDTPVSLAEIAPTILHAAGVPPPSGMKGRDLLHLKNVPSRAEAELYSETEYPRAAGWAPLQALADARWKTIRAGMAAELYDVQQDPGEVHDLAHAHASIAAAMSARAVVLHDAGAAPAAPVSADARDRLRALGYVAPSASSSTGDDNAPNPSTAIAAWNDFEKALARVAAHDPGSVEMLKRLADDHPAAIVFRSTYARALADAGRPLAALTVYREAVRRWPAEATLLHDLAVAAREAAGGETANHGESLRQEAVRAEQAAIALDPKYAAAANGAGLLAIDADRPADAVALFERATTLDPTNASYWVNLGNARRALGDRSRAEAAYRRALAVDPDAADAANGLGVLLVDARRPAQAAPWFERAIAAAPDLVEAQLNLAIALQQSGRIDEAAAAYRRVLAAPARFARERDAAAKLLASLGTPR